VQQPRRNKPNLSLVADDVDVSVSHLPSDVLLSEADEIEALNGPNPYSDYLRKHLARPARNQAAAIGRIMGARVRAADGTMQPRLTAGEQAAVRSIKKRRREWARQLSHVQRTMTAIAALSENKDDPSAVVSYGNDVFSDPAVRARVEFALCWLS